MDPERRGCEEERPRATTALLVLTRCLLRSHTLLFRDVNDLPKAIQLITSV